MFSIKVSTVKCGCHVSVIYCCFCIVAVMKKKKKEIKEIIRYFCLKKLYQKLKTKGK
jgi:hypothetical protein